MLKVQFKENSQLTNITVTVEAHKKNQEVNHLLDYLANFNHQLQMYIIEKDGEVYKFPISDFLWIEVFGDYTTIHTKNTEITIRKTLQTIESELPTSQFVRVSRNTLVNLQAIIKVESSFSGNMTAYISETQTIHISRKYWKNLKQRILEDE